jgi:hypothetical protein
MFLIDTNIWLERMLGQEQSQSVGEFLDRTPQELLCITDFSFHSIGVILTLTRLKQPPALVQFVRDIFILVIPRHVAQLPGVGMPKIQVAGIFEKIIGYWKRNKLLLGYQ